MDPTVAKIRARVAGMSRTRPANDPELVTERDRLRAARVDQYINRLVAEAPPLNDHQRTVLSGLLQPLPNDGGKAA